jgi:hypothetical protein
VLVPRLPTHPPRTPTSYATAAPHAAWQTLPGSRNARARALPARPQVKVLALYHDYILIDRSPGNSCADTVSPLCNLVAPHVCQALAVPLFSRC